jgi:hypothetical protein
LFEILPCIIEKAKLFLAPWLVAFITVECFEREPRIRIKEETQPEKKKKPCPKSNSKRKGSYTYNLNPEFSFV